MLKRALLLGFSILLLSLIAFRGGFASIYVDTDFGRDLSELSNLMAHKIVWLGPRLSAGFPASPIYYYLFFPFLWLAQGDPRSLIITNLGLAGIALAGLGWWVWKEWGKRALLGVWATGLSPWWLSTGIHPGNGFSYVFWLFGGLVTLYFELPLFVSSLLIGIAIAHHPAAIFALPILGFEVWRRRAKLKLLPQLPLLGLGLLLPWGPIIAFEVITKGYLIRQFLANPSSQYYFEVGLRNVTEVSALSGFNLGEWLALWLTAVVLASKRLRIWGFLASLGILAITLISPLPGHYLLSLVVISWTIMILSLIRHKIGVVILLGLLLFFSRNLVRTGWPQPAARSIPSLEYTVDRALESGKLDPGDPIAVVAAMSMKAEVPQADDYRFFLRRRGYNVLEVNQYAQADKLIMFIEFPGFPWKDWSSWEIEQLGEKTQVYYQLINNTEVVIFQKR